MQASGEPGDRRDAEEQPPLPRRVGGNLALDLANTFSFRGTAREVDHLATVEAVRRWAVAAGLIEDGWSPATDEARTLVATVHRLRRAVDATGAAIAHSEEPPAEALATIRDLAAGSLARATLAGVPAHLSFDGPDRIVGPVAWAALDLLRGSDLDRLKQCPPEDCHWLFIDRTKNGSRRWCEMATCGDKAKRRARRSGTG
ncbi:CGNR zinc finger domain-containing protein [Frigidibacter oleivorans]|uniref:CGNR zinc finger domain-containing protein n=1 Tax=Frigidibacter oleivorans TaxID=2487129 RepID=UPI000F8D0B51|nr:ABATE domain-containing protein [Frigidibacter oleivorans]